MTPLGVTLPFSWPDNPDTRFFSGTTTFSRTINLPANPRQDGTHIFLDFGEVNPARKESLSADTLRGYSFAALVTTPHPRGSHSFVNGKRAGSMWAPPY